MEVDEEDYYDERSAAEDSANQSKLFVKPKKSLKTVQKEMN